MKDKNMYNGRLSRTAIPLIILILVLFGCSEKIVHDETMVSVKICPDTDILFTLQMGQITTYRLTVDAEDFEEPIYTPLVLDGALLLGEVDIPAGPNRHFVAEALDTGGTVIYGGDAYEDVEYNSTVQVNIDLLPVVPLMKVTPRYLSLEMEQPFSIDVSVFNIPELKSVEFDLVYITDNEPIYLDSIVKGADLDLDDRFSYEGDYSSVRVWIDDASGDEAIVDAQGDARLASFYFGTHSDVGTEIEADTAFMIIIPVELNRGSSDVPDLFPLDELYPDRGMVELIKPAVK